MGRDVAADRRAEIRRKNAERQYLDGSRVWSPDIREEAESRLILHKAFSVASPEQYRTANLRAQGYSFKETAQMQGIQAGPQAPGGAAEDLHTFIYLTEGRIMS